MGFGWPDESTALRPFWPPCHSGGGVDIMGVYVGVRQLISGKPVYIPACFCAPRCVLKNVKSFTRHTMWRAIPEWQHRRKPRRDTSEYWAGPCVWGGDVGSSGVVRSECRLPRCSREHGSRNNFPLVPLLPCTDLMQDLRGHMPVALGKYQDSREHGIDGGRWLWILRFSYLTSAY